jgi:hypothetical protein
VQLSTRRQCLLVLLGAALLGAIPAGLLTMAWASENLGGDFADLETGKLDVGFTAATFLIWTALFAGPLAVIGGFGILARRASRRRRSAPRTL